MKPEGPTSDSSPTHTAGRSTRLSSGRAFWLFGRLALQNLGRRPARTLLLALAVAFGSGTLFAATTLIRGIEASMAIGFSRLGADLLVIPRETLVNLKAALLTVEPTSHTFDEHLADEIRRIPGVRRVAPQRFLRSSDSHSGLVEQSAVIAFDPQQDLTVLPWVSEQLDRALQKGDVIIGGLVDSRIGDQISFYGRPLTVYGRLGRTGVGTYDHALFVTFETAKALVRGDSADSSIMTFPFESGRLSGLLVQLDVDAMPEAVRFAIAKHSDVKVVPASSPLTSVRQILTSLFGGILALAFITLVVITIMVSIIFSAIIAERGRELGLLRAIGATRLQIVRLIVVESAVVTGLGGLAGVALGTVVLRVYGHSLIFYFENMNVSFIWPTIISTLLLAIGCVLLSAVIGMIGALYPAWRATRQDPYDLIRLSEG